MPRRISATEGDDSRRGHGRDHVCDDQPPPPGTTVSNVVGELTALGLSVGVRKLGGLWTAAGVTARVSLDALVGPGDALDRSLSLVYSALRAGIAVTVTVADPSAEAASDRLAKFRQRFCEFLDAAAVDRQLLGLCLSAGELPSPEFRTDFRRRLGDGPRYVLLPLGQFCHAATVTNDVWRLLQYSESGGPRFWPVYPAGVRSHCPLLSAESGGSVIPDTGITAPSGSAWLPIGLDISRFADASGSIDESRLDRALDGCIEFGDWLIDRLSWFDVRQQHDAQANRRLAVTVTGLGELVHRRGEDPASFRCLRDLDQVVTAIHEGLWLRSQRLAERLGPLPSLLEKQPSAAWRDETHRQDWLMRWRNTLSKVQVRHRNLLVLSPYAMLPSACPASPDYADLLPVLAHADAFSFAGPPSLAHWNTSDFKGFHQRIQALAERRNTASFVAAGV